MPLRYGITRAQSRYLVALFAFTHLAICPRPLVGDDGILMLHARRCRTQESNRRDAIDRLVELIDKACERPTPRRATKPTAGSQKRRLDAKKRRGAIKEGRRTREPGDD